MYHCRIFWNYETDLVLWICEQLSAESTNYDVYATTYVDDSVLTDPVELAAATNTMKNDPDIYYQKSLELLEAMLIAAEFREPVDSWFE